MTGFAARLGLPGGPAEALGVFWLVAIWVALIAVWGASERWDVPAAGRRLARTVHLAGRLDDRAGD